MKKYVVKLGTLVTLFALYGCGGGGTETKQKSPLPNESNESGGAANVFKPDHAVAMDNDSTRISKMLAIADIVYLDSDITNGGLNYDFKHDNSDGYYAEHVNDGYIHTGIDMASRKGAGVNIGSLVNGTVIDINTDSGGVIVQTHINDTVYHITHLHLDNISVKVGDTVKQSQHIGFESNVSNFNLSQHLHIEASVPCIYRENGNPGLLSISPNSSKWDYAVDPLSLVDFIVNDGSAIVQANTFFLNVNFIDESGKSINFEPGKKNYIDGCALNPKGFEDEVFFTITDKDNIELYNKDYDVSHLLSADRTVLSFHPYYFGTEEPFKAGGNAAKLKINVTENGGNSTLKELDVSALPEDKDNDTIFEMDLASEYFYFTDYPRFKGCVSDADGISSLTVKVRDIERNIHYPNYVRSESSEDPITGLEKCEGETGRVVDDLRYRGVSDLTLGKYSIEVEAKDASGNIRRSDLFRFEVRNQVSTLEGIGILKSNSSNKYVLKRIEYDSNYFKGMSIPTSCIHVKIKDDDYHITQGFVQNDIDLGFDRLEFSKSFPSITVAGSYPYKVYYKCSESTPETTLATGTLTYE